MKVKLLKLLREEYSISCFESIEKVTYGYYPDSVSNGQTWITLNDIVVSEFVLWKGGKRVYSKSSDENLSFGYSYIDKEELEEWKYFVARDSVYDSLLDSFSRSCLLRYGGLRKTRKKRREVLEDRCREREYMAEEAIMIKDREFLLRHKVR